MRKKSSPGINDPVLEEQARRVAPKLAVLIVSEILDLSQPTVRAKYLKSDDVGELWVELAKDCLVAGMRYQANWRDRIKRK